MNYYKRHLGDYAKNTRTLSTYEHGVYNLLLDLYYTDEGPISADDAYAICRASSEAETASVDKVLSKFFVPDGDLFRHERADEEIAKYRETAAKNKANGKRGGRPTESDKEPKNNPVGFQTDSEPEPKNNLSHKPLAISQEEAKADELRSSVASDGQAATPACPHEAIVAAYHEILPELPRVRVWDSGRQQFLRSRWRESPERQTLDWWREFFKFVRRCPFLLGQQAVGDRDPFLADLEWLIRPQNFRKVIEGKYESRRAA